MNNLGVAQIGRQGQHHLVEIGAFAMPIHQALDGKGMAIMQAWCGMRAAIGPVEVIAQPIEDTMHLSVAKRLPQTATAGEERGVIRRRHSALAA